MFCDKLYDYKVTRLCDIKVAHKYKYKNYDGWKNGGGTLWGAYTQGYPATPTGFAQGSRGFLREGSPQS